MHHNASKAAFQQGRREDRSCGAHSNDVLVSIGEILGRLSIVALTAEEYVLAIHDAARDGVVGATIYDALLARCAMKAQADVIYTWNLKHFRQFPEIRSLVRTP